MYSLSSDVSCGILVYKLVTSIDTRIAVSGTFVLSIYHGALYQSLRYDFCCCANCWSSMSTNSDNFSVGPETPEIIAGFPSRFVDFPKGVKGSVVFDKAIFQSFR